MSLDWTILGIVFALILFIIVFSAIVLYMAFRIKEAFREEKRRGILVAKIGFLIGILFLAGGSFYFFAQTLTPTTPSNQTTKPELTLTISYPSEATRNTQITISFTITNLTEYTAHDAVIQANQLFEHFSVISSTHELTGNTVNIGDIPPGTTVSSLQLKSPKIPREVSDNITLTFTEMSKPITQQISISVKGGPK